MAGISNPFGNISNPLDNLLGGGDGQIAATSGDAGRSLVIEEQGVPGARRITLKGRAMPYQGVEWGGEQRHKTTYYPGNPVASQQLLGPLEGPTTMEGTWKDRFMPGAILVEPAAGSGGGTSDGGGLGGAVAGAGKSALSKVAKGAASALGLNSGGDLLLAEEVVQMFHGIRRAGTSVRVQYLSEIRFGIISDFTARYLRPQDIEWSITFDWRSWDDDIELRSASLPQDASNLLDKLNKVLDVIANAPFAVQQFQAQLATSINNLANTTQVLFDVMRTIDAVTDLPGTILGNALGTVRQLVAQATDLIRQIADVRWPVISSAQSLAGPTVDPLTNSTGRSAPTKQGLEYERWRRAATLALADLRRTASDSVDQRVRQRIPKTTRVVEIREGASLYDLSTKFYGSPDFANYLATVNGLTSVSVSAGTQIRVPPRSTGPTVVSLVGSRKKDCTPCCPGES